MNKNISTNPMLDPYKNKDHKLTYKKIGRPLICPRENTHYGYSGCGNSPCTCCWDVEAEKIDFSDIEKVQVRNRLLEASIKNIRALLNLGRADEALEFIDKNFDFK